MDESILKAVGQIAGIGGLSLGVLLIVFRDVIRKKIFPQLRKDDAYRLLRLITVLTFLIALAGIAAWTWSGRDNAEARQQSTINGDNNRVNQGISK